MSQIITVAGRSFVVQMVEGMAYAEGEACEAVCDFDHDVILLSSLVPESRVPHVIREMANFIAREMGLTLPVIPRLTLSF